MIPAEVDILKSFHDLAVKERDHGRRLAQRYHRELVQAKVRLGELGVGALLTVAVE
jgi:hypothetical protein